jgi:hypothetical protein
MYEGKKPRAIQISWPYQPAPGEGEAAAAELYSIHKAAQFTLFIAVN